MSSIYNRTIILTICRLANYVIGIVSPIILVRILTKGEFGQYAEFLAFATLLVPFIGLGIQRNLLYFVPIAPRDERAHVTHTALLLLIGSILGSSVILAIKPIILKHTSYDFVTPLILYLFFLLNLDILDTYWLAKKRSDFVLYYSGVRVVLRVLVVVVTASQTKSVPTILSAMIIFEAARFAYCLYYLLSRRLLEPRISLAILKEQLVYSLPLGLAAIIFYFNRQIGLIFIGDKLGPESLADYKNGATQVPIIAVVRGSVTDIVFPEMAQRGARDPMAGLSLWKRSNIVFCFFVFPLATLFYWYSELIIKCLFTAEYLAAVPIFQVFLILMVRQCFEMGSPLRALNQNTHFFVGNIIFLAVNIPLLLVLYRTIGFVGPAFAFVLGDLALSIYLGYWTVRAYKVSLSDLLLWPRVLKIAMACAAGVPVLYGVGKIPLDASGFFERTHLGSMGLNEFVLALIGSCLFGVLYFIILRLCRIDELDLLVSVAKRKLSGSSGTR